MESAVLTVMQLVPVTLLLQPEETEQLQVAALVEVVVVILDADQITVEEPAVLVVLEAKLAPQVKQLDL